MENNKERLEVTLFDGYKLCACAGGDETYREMYVYLEDRDGNEQEIALIGYPDPVKDPNEKHDLESIRVLLWQNEKVDEATGEYTVPVRKIYNVDFQMGPGRNCPDDVDYMLATVGDVELYAEEPVPNWVRPETKDVSKFDSEVYPRLKAAIIEQAKAAGIDPDTLAFWWD